MKICIAQTQSQKGQVQKNIDNHIAFITRASALQADVIVFPELSITGYEPSLAKALVSEVTHSVFNVFQDLCDTKGITIGVGVPTKATHGICISMLIFQPHTKRTVYSKQMLHADELPYFVCGDHQTVLTIKDTRIGLGICYETLQRAHFLNANKQGVDIYIASVAKPKGGVERAYTHFSAIAQEFATPILMSNCVGYCDNFMSVGQSAVWNKKGDVLAQLDSNNQGYLYMIPILKG